MCSQTAAGMTEPARTMAQSVWTRPSLPARGKPPLPLPLLRLAAGPGQELVVLVLVAAGSGRRSVTIPCVCGGLLETRRNTMHSTD